MRRDPPRLATALLARFSDNDALAGDLRESYADGASRWWYRRQVLTAITTSVVHGSRAEPSRTVSAVLFGAGCVWLGTEYVPILPRLGQWLFETGLNRWLYVHGYGLPRFAGAFPALAVWKAGVFGLASYAMANIDRRAAIPFALTIAVGNFVLFVLLSLSGASAYSMMQLVTDLVVFYPLAAVVGAFAGHARSRPRSS